MIFKRKDVRGTWPTIGDSGDPDLATDRIFANAFAQNTGPAAGEGTDPGLGERAVDIPILAFKRATLTWSPGGHFAVMAGYDRAGRVQESATARCLRDGGYGLYVSPAPDHDAPAPQCNCGFHAVPDISDLNADYGPVILDVELSGRVIVHEKGYRAEHQRILAARINTCWWCGEAAAVVAIEHELESAYKGGSRSVYKPRPLCESHAPHSPVTVPLAVVADRIGLPVGVVS